MLQELMNSIENQIYFGGHTPFVLEDIAEYAKQVSIDFLKWTETNAYRNPSFPDNLWCKLPVPKQAEFEYLNAEELLELYLKSNSK